MNEIDLEKLRKKAIKFALAGIVLCILVDLLVVLFTKDLNYVVPIFFIGMLMVTFFNKPYRDFKSNFKEVFVVKALESVFFDFEYEQNKGIDKSAIKSTNMMQLGDRYSSKNLIRGKYKGVYLEQSDIHIEQCYETKDGPEWETLFKGRWMIFDFNKNFKANVLVKQSKFRNSKGHGVFSNLHKIVTEDESFNKQFRVYTPDDHEAFYILTPSLMEKIKDVANGIDGSLIFCFVDNKLHVGINNHKESFNHSILKRVDASKVERKIGSDIKLITDFVDKLSLDSTLFKRSLIK